MEAHINGVKTKTQMACEFGVCRKTFNKMLRSKNIYLERGLIPPKDQLKIYKELGIPNCIQKFPLVP